MNNNYKSDLPYPEIRVTEPNLYYAYLLKEDYTGMVSEMTAINQYLYHYFDIEGYDEEIAKPLEEIAIVEMHHLEILAKLIMLLGDKPTYYTQNGFWNGSYVEYGNTVLGQLESDLLSEYKAIDTYKHHISIINDPYIKQILERIILDEQVHVILFKELIEKVKNKQ